MYQQIKILSHVFKSDLDTYKLGYYKLAEGFRLLNWIDWNFSDTPAFYKQTYYSYHAVFKFLSNLKQNSGRNLLRLLAEIPGYEEYWLWRVYCQVRLRQVCEASPRYAQWNWHFEIDTAVLKS